MAASSSLLLRLLSCIVGCAFWRQVNLPAGMQTCRTSSWSSAANAFRMRFGTNRCAPQKGWESGLYLDQVSSLFGMVVGAVVVTNASGVIWSMPYHVHGGMHGMICP